MLNKIRKNSMHMTFKFRETPGCGLAKCLPQGSTHFLDVLSGLLEYDPDERMSARQALRHPYFADQRKADPNKKGGEPTRASVEEAPKGPPKAKGVKTAVVHPDPTARPQRENGTALPQVKTKPAANNNHVRRNKVRQAPKINPRVVHHPLLQQQQQPRHRAPARVPPRKWQGAAPRDDNYHVHKSKKTVSTSRLW